MRRLAVLFLLLLPLAAVAGVDADDQACVTHADDTTVMNDGVAHGNDYRDSYVDCMERLGYHGQELQLAARRHYPAGTCVLDGHTTAAMMGLTWLVGLGVFGGLATAAARASGFAGKIRLTRIDGAILIGSAIAGVTVWLMLLLVLRSYFCA